MATRSNIAYKNSIGEFEYIYHHFDGYISYLGKYLNQELNNEDLVKNLFEVGKSIEATISIKEHLKKEKEAEGDNNRYSYTKLLKDTDNRQIGNLFVKFFKEKDVTTGKSKSKKELIDNCNESYLYLYENKKWHVKISATADFIDLSFAIKVTDLTTDILALIKKEEELTQDKSDVVQKKINKSYKLITMKKTMEEEVFFKELLKLEKDDFIQSVKDFSKMKEIIIFNNKISKNLLEKNTKKIIKSKL